MRRTVMQGFMQKRHLVGCVLMCIVVVLVTLRFGQSNYCNINKIEYICIEDTEAQNKTGLEDVRPLPINPNDQIVHNGQKLFSPMKLSNMNFTHEEKNRISLCLQNSKNDMKKGHGNFWHGDTQFIRRTHHKYLKPRESIIVEVGGNVGEDAEAYLHMYKPKYLVVLEPLKLLYRKLLQRFRNDSNVIVHNVGLGAKYDKFMIRMEGNIGDATSPFFGSGEGSCSLKVVNAIDFFHRLGVGTFKVDLLTINCEGCEYELMETLVSTNLIHHFNHIQIGTHPQLKNLPDPVGRYCKLQEWLGRTHQITYQYKFTWETWKLKGL